MKSPIPLVLALLAVSIPMRAQKIPEGYLLQYQQNFSSGKALDDFKVRNPSKWGVFKASNNFYLQCTAADSIPLIPENIALINNRIFGDFIIEADVMPLKDSLGRAEACFFLGYRDSSRYYYVQLSSIADSNTHGIFLVRNNSRSRLTGDDETAVTWNSGKWHKIRLERDIVGRTIVLYLDDMTVPQLRIKDFELIMGSVGFGSLAGRTRFDNIKIWAPTVISE